MIGGKASINVRLITRHTHSSKNLQHDQFGTHYLFIVFIFSHYVRQ